MKDRDEKMKTGQRLLTLIHPSSFRLHPFHTGGLFARMSVRSCEPADRERSLLSARNRLRSLKIYRIPCVCSVLCSLLIGALWAQTPPGTLPAGMGKPAAPSAQQQPAASSSLLPSAAAQAPRPDRPIVLSPTLDQLA